MISAEAARLVVASIPHWHHRFEIYPGVVTPGSYDPMFLWEKLRIEDRCAGRRVLDIGASDGFFTRGMAMLGADVVAVDYRAKASHGFVVMEQLSGKVFNYEHANLFDLDVERLGRFDIVLFLGVLYHLPDMMRALHKLRSVCGSTLFIETHSDSQFSPDVPAARYFKSGGLNEDFTNFWSPNAACVIDMLYDAGFDVVRHEVWADRFFAEAVVSDNPARSHKMNVAYGRIGAVTPHVEMPVPASRSFAQAEAAAAAGLSAAQLLDAEAIRMAGLFDPAFYQQQLDERSLQAGPDPILHYVETGEALGLLPHRLFDPAYYRAASGGVCLVGPALAHFIREGSRLGLRTHPLFDAGYYNTHNPDIPQAGMNALFHYLNFGGLEGRRPHPLFHSWLYIQGAPRLRDTKEDPLSHYLRGGWREGRNPHPLFDTAYYLARYPDVAAAGVNPLVHFVIAGLAEGRRPNPLFSPEAFRLSGADQPRLTEAGVAAMDAACRTQRMPAEDHAVLQAEVARRRGRTAVAGSLPGNIGIVSEEAGKEGGSGTRVIAFYLPQFHPIPENDQNWGEGFTEWTNVRRAKPNFPGHDQPRQPGELGYYDLRDANVMEQQAALAREHGVHGFCYYWYWFNGRKPLAMPLERMRDTGSPDLPFCLCWANEGWTRKWAGGDQVIFDHAYSDGDDELHAAELARYMMDPRYIKVAGAPLFLIYRADAMPDLPGYPSRLRAALRRAGVDSVHLALVESGVFAWAGRDPRPLGFDSAVEFPPHGGNGMLPPLPDMLNPSFSGAIFDYRQTVLRYAGAPLPPYPRWRTVMAAWDNTPRYQDNPAIFMNATPGGYRAWLEGAVRDVQASWPPGERLVFVNAWNEWGEGTVLEPDVRWGRAYLEATRDALADAGEAVRQEVGDGGHG
jgi:SAM-dependent methyltransferase